MARQVVDIGIEGNDGTGDSIREAFKKVNENFNEIYAVFGQGSQLQFLNLSDVPSEYTNHENKLVSVNSSGEQLQFVELASNNALDNSADTIGFDYSIEGKLIVKQLSSRVSNDYSPSLNGPLNATQFPIGNIEVSQNAVDKFNNIHDTNITVDSLVIDKKFADQHYQPKLIKQGGLKANFEDLTIDRFKFSVSIDEQGYLVKPNHLFSTEYNGSKFRFESSNTAPTGIISNNTYFIRIIDQDKIGLYESYNNALTNINRLELTGGSGDFYLIDEYYDDQLIGNWLSNDVLPRESVVRRQGDQLLGPIYAHDHPGQLQGFGTPNDISDLQLASKLYVDNSATYSKVNLYVATTGDDYQFFTPHNRIGRSLGYAFKSISRALDYANDIISASPVSIISTSQTLSYDMQISLISSIDFNSDNTVKTLINKNIPFIVHEVQSYIQQEFSINLNDVNIIIDIVKSIQYDVLNGSSTNRLSRLIGFKLVEWDEFNKTQISIILDFIKSLMHDILLNISITPLQSQVSQYINVSLIVSSATITSVNLRFDNINNIVTNGIAHAPELVPATKTYSLYLQNGGLILDQGNPQNNELLPNKLIKGHISGALGRIIEYIPNSLLNQDEIQIELLNPIEFLLNESVEVGNFVLDRHVSIFVESGIYQEDFPLRIPKNVSLIGNDSSRCIIEPKNRPSQSNWTNLSFFRNHTIDNIDLGLSGIPDDNTNTTGYFGNHYLIDTTSDLIVSGQYTNYGKWYNVTTAIKNNKFFLIEEVDSYVKYLYPLFHESLLYPVFKHNLSYIIDCIILDLEFGSNEYSIEAQYKLVELIASENLVNEYVSSINKLQSLILNIINNIEPINTYNTQIVIDLTMGVLLPYEWTANTFYRRNDIVTYNSNTYISMYDHTSATILDINELTTNWLLSDSLSLIIENLFDTILYSTNSNYNPPLHNKDIDVFLLNDSSVIKNISVQDHNSFMAVLDPTGLIHLPPRIESCSITTEFSNEPHFKGSIFVDGFVNSIKVDAYNNENNRLFIENIPSKLNQEYKFYVNGTQYTVLQVQNYNPLTHTAELILDTQLSITSTISIILYVNDNKTVLVSNTVNTNNMGYGILATNNSKVQVNMSEFLYCSNSMYVTNGANIQSNNCISSYGTNGIVADGVDPNEVPDEILLANNMVQSGKILNAEIVLTLTDLIIVEAGEEITQQGSFASATVIQSTNQQFGSNVLYLTNVTGTFNLINELEISTTIVGDSTVTFLGPGSIPVDIEYLEVSDTSIYVYDMEYMPLIKSSFGVINPIKSKYYQYDIKHVETYPLAIGVHKSVPYIYSPPGGNPHPFAGGAEFDVKRTIYHGYLVDIRNSGNYYRVGDTFIVHGIDLGGNESNDAIITVSEIDAQDTGPIKSVIITGLVLVDDTVPTFNNIIYRLHLTTEFEDIGNNAIIEYKNNKSFLFNNIDDANLSIRPATTLSFNNEEEFYRLTSIISNVSNETQFIVDNSYDYIRLYIDNIHAKSSDLALSGTKGSLSGDTQLAIKLLPELKDVYRLNNNTLTPQENRPLNWTTQSLTQAPIISYQGKVHYVYNYREVDSFGNIVPNSPSNVYAIVDILDLPDSSYFTEVGIASAMTDIDSLVLYAGLHAVNAATLVKHISVCTANSHKFNFVGSGNIDQTFDQYNNVINFVPTNEIIEYNKGKIFSSAIDQFGTSFTGDLLKIDQGTGEVSIAADISLSGLSGLGFDKGVTVTEFSIDTAMIDNSNDAVPTEYAVKSYIDRRLGFDSTNNIVVNPIGSNVLSANGIVPLEANLNANNNTITNVRLPMSETDATPKEYVDSAIISSYANDNVNISNLETTGLEVGQLMAYSGFKRIYVFENTVANGEFYVDDVIQGSISNAQGIIKYVRPVIMLSQPVIEIIYDPIIGEFSDGKPIETSEQADTIYVINGASALMFVGPVLDWVNTTVNPLSSITLESNTICDVINNVLVDKFTELDFQIKSNVITNTNINANAMISHSKLNINSASTRLNADNISNLELGLASFNSAIFSSTNGWIDINDNSISKNKLTQISQNTVLGNLTNSSYLEEISFSDIVEQGGGLAINNFTNTVPSISDPGSVIVKLPDSTFGISNITTQGEVNSLIKTNENGSIQVNSLILGGDSSYEILSLTDTTVILKTPGQGEIIKASGSGQINITIPGNLTVGDLPISESSIQSFSDYQGKSSLTTNWIYTNFIEAQGEKSNASTGIAIGNWTGRTTNGEVAIVTADTVADTSLTPFIFSSTGVLPDETDSYSIGSKTHKYSTVHATTTHTSVKSPNTDIAENFLADEEYIYGTVLIFGGNQEITTTTIENDTRIAGVVSTNPAYLMNSELQGTNVCAIALQGRIHCRVTGTVAKGDFIVTSTIPGLGKSTTTPSIGTIIGKSLEEKTTTDEGLIEIVIGKY